MRRLMKELSIEIDHWEYTQSYILGAEPNDAGYFSFYAKSPNQNESVTCIKEVFISFSSPNEDHKYELEKNKLILEYQVDMKRLFKDPQEVKVQWTVSFHDEYQEPDQSIATVFDFAKQEKKFVFSHQINY